MQNAQTTNYKLNLKSSAIKIKQLKPNVLQLVGSFNQGGSERQAVQLARLLHEDKSFRVFVGALDGAGILRGEIEELQIGAIPEFPLDSFYNPNFVRQVFRCAAFIRRNNIRIVHTHDFYTNIFGMTAARFANVPCKIASKRETGEMRSRKQQNAEKFAFRFADAIIVNAAAVRNFLSEQNVANDKITIIYNGLDVNRLEPKQTVGETLVEFGLPNDKKLVTLVANLRHAVKNQPMFLQAAALVKQKFSNAAFVLAGEGDLENELKRLAAALGIERDVYFVGRCTKIADLLASSEIGVLSSLAEGFSNAILEYMCAGLPVVATRVGGAAEAIIENETGFLVESNDQAAMAEKILRLLENSELAQKFGARGCEIVEQKFSLDAQLKQTLQLYEKILASKTRNP